MLVAKIKAKYYCPECNNWFNDPYIHEWDESRGEYWGRPCSEHMVEYLCPYCDSSSILDRNELFEDEDIEDEDE